MTTEEKYYNKQIYLLIQIYLYIVTTEVKHVTKNSKIKTELRSRLTREKLIYMRISISAIDHFNYFGKGFTLSNID